MCKVSANTSERVEFPVLARRRAGRQMFEKLMRKTLQSILSASALGLIAIYTSGCDTTAQNDMYNLMEGITHPETWQLPAIPVRQVNMNEKSLATVTNHYSFGTFLTNKATIDIAWSDTKK